MSFDKPIAFAVGVYLILSAMGFLRGDTADVFLKKLKSEVVATHVLGALFVLCGSSLTYYCITVVRISHFELVTVSLLLVGIWWLAIGSLLLAFPSLVGRLTDITTLEFKRFQIVLLLIGVYLVTVGLIGWIPY